MFSRVVVPLDGSPLGEVVVEWVRQLVGIERSRVYLVHVVPESEPVAMYDGLSLISVPAVVPEEQSALEGAAARYLAGVADLFGPAADVRPLVRTGRPAPEIVRAARECGADLIAMSTHGRTGLGRLVLGSVADEVVREAGLPVVLLHPDAVALRAAPAGPRLGGAVGKP